MDRDNNIDIPPAELNKGAPPQEEILKCAECSYNLRGLSIDNDCPECGFKIRSSVELQSKASARKLFTILLRFFAVLIPIEPLASRTGYIHKAILYFLKDNNYSYSGPDHWLVALGPPAAIIFLAIFFWVMAPILAKLAAPVDAPVIINLGGLRNGLIITAFVFAMWLMASSIDKLSMIVARVLSMGLTGFKGEYAQMNLGIGIFRFVAGGILILMIIRYHKRHYEANA